MQIVDINLLVIVHTVQNESASPTNASQNGCVYSTVVFARWGQLPP